MGVLPGFTKVTCINQFGEKEEDEELKTKWCLFMMPLELFFKDKARCESHRDISPHLSPQRGHPMISDRPLFTSILSWFACFAASPISVGFMARAALDVFKPRSPKTSLIAHAKTSSRTDGLNMNYFLRRKINEPQCWQ
jgi:hypothetical protein